MILVELPGPPKGKGRPRFSRKSGTAYTPTTTRRYEAALRAAGQEAMGDSPPLEGPLRVIVEALMPIPVSWPKKRRSAALAGETYPTTTPDWENIAKCCDGLNSVCWVDDRQIVDGRVIKRYSAEPCLKVYVESV